MSMNYGVVKPSFWTGRTGRELRHHHDAQAVALYLMTSPHANIIGVFRCPIGYIAAETGRPIEGASKGLLKLVDMGFCTVDPETETVWVHEMARFQIGETLNGKDKRVKHVARFFADIENLRIKWAFFEKYGSAYQLIVPTEPRPLTSPIEGASKPLPSSPIEATVTVTSTVTDTVTAHPSDGAPTKNRKTKSSRSSPKAGVPDGDGFDALKHEFLAQADSRGIGALSAQEQFERFLDHHRAKGSVFADWDAAGRTWLNNTVKFEKERQAGRGGAGPPRGRANSGLTDFLLGKHMEQQHDGPTIDLDADDIARH